MFEVHAAGVPVAVSIPSWPKAHAAGKKAAAEAGHPVQIVFPSGSTMTVHPAVVAAAA